MEQELLLELLISLVCRKRVRVVLVLQTIHVRLDILSKHKITSCRFAIMNATSVMVSVFTSEHSHTSSSNRTLLHCSHSHPRPNFCTVVESAFVCMCMSMCKHICIHLQPISSRGYCISQCCIGPWALGPKPLTTHDALCTLHS